MALQKDFALNCWKVSLKYYHFAALKENLELTVLEGGTDVPKCIRTTYLYISKNFRVFKDELGPTLLEARSDVLPSCIRTRKCQDKA